MINNKNIKLLENNVIYLDNLLLNEKPNHDKINKLLFDIKKKILKYKIELNQFEQNGHLNKNLTHYKKRLDILSNNIKLVDDYNTDVMNHNKKKSIDTLTIINTIFLPLTLITGYYGMNFKSMGSNSKSRGIFTIKNGELLVFALFFILTTIIILLFRYNIIPG